MVWCTYVCHQYVPLNTTIIFLVYTIHVHVCIGSGFLPSLSLRLSATLCNVVCYIYTHVFSCITATRYIHTLLHLYTVLCLLRMSMCTNTTDTHTHTQVQISNSWFLYSFLRLHPVTLLASCFGDRCWNAITQFMATVSTSCLSGNSCLTGHFLFSSVSLTVFAQMEKHYRLLN